MKTELSLIAVAALIVSAILTGMVRRAALSKGMLDVPNERSSHKVPTPRGGGIAIATATTAGLALLTAFGALRLDVFGALCGGIAVAVIGFLDDRRPLSARVRLAVHFAAAVWGLAWLGGLPPLRAGEHLVTWGASGYLLGSLFLVWTLNLFNFMDGIDGIAATEAIFVTFGAALLLGLTTGVQGTGGACLILAAASCGFLLWNWPPARIFMGDVGSGYLGYVIGVLAIVATRDEPAALWSWLILGGVFFVDASVTLLRRTVRGDRVYESHRNHAYQWLARRWGSHNRVTIAVILINLLWLFPCAALATRYIKHAPLIAAVALTPIVVIAIIAGSGRPEIRAS